MTGFAKTQSTTPHFIFTIQIKTLNSKGLDVNVRLPFMLRTKELDIRKILADELFAGKIEVFVKLENISLQQSVIDMTLAKWYFEQLKMLESELQIKEEGSLLQLLLSLPDVLKFSDEEIPQEDLEVFMESLKNACRDVMDYRKTEGMALEKDILTQLDIIKNAFDQIPSYAEARLDLVRSKILQELKLWQEKHGQSYDEKRLEEEMIYYADRLDINEELVRLNQHITYFLDVMNDTTSFLKGKKLTFIAQEMGREINTLGNKSNMYEIQRLVVDMKTALEKIKEHLSNVL